MDPITTEYEYREAQGRLDVLDELYIQLAHEVHLSGANPTQDAWLVQLAQMRSQTRAAMAAFDSPKQVA